MYEMFGSFVVVFFTIYATSNVKAPGGTYPLFTTRDPYAVGFALTMMTQFCWHVSGSHFNPSISMAVLICEKKMANLSIFLGMALMQVIGAFIAVTMAILTNHKTGKHFCGENQKGDAATCFTDMPISSPYFMFSKDGEYGQLILLQIVASFIFTLIYLVQKYEPAVKTLDTTLKSISIGVAYTVSSTVVSLAGAALNPVVPIATAPIFQAFYSQYITDMGVANAVDGAHYTNLIWAPVVFSFAGSALAAAFFVFAHKPVLETNPYAKIQEQS